MKKTKYTNKNVIVEAYQSQEEVIVKTTSGDAIAKKGDWIVTGENREKYICNPNIFEKVYSVYSDPKQPYEDEAIREFINKYGEDLNKLDEEHEIICCTFYIRTYEDLDFYFNNLRCVIADNVIEGKSHLNTDLIKYGKIINEFLLGNYYG